MKQIGIKYGIICGLVYIVLNLAGILTGISSQAGGNVLLGMVINGVVLILTFLVIYMGIKELRDDVQGGNLTIGDAIKAGVLIALIASILAALFTLLYQNVIDPGYMDEIVEATRDSLEERGMSEEQIEQSMKITEMFRSPLLTVGFTIIWIAFWGLIKGLVAGAILKQEKPAV